MVRNLVNGHIASANKQATPQLSFRNSQSAIRNRPQGLTLIEMLIGMAITLVMMAAVVNLFANIGSGIRVRRASMEMSGQLRMARARLFKDLAGATCDGIPKSKREDSLKADGYIEIIEGGWSDKAPSILVDGTDNGPTSANPELDYASSIIPGSNLPLAAGSVTDGGGLGDYDDILALTVRSETEPFVGRYVDSSGNPSTVESKLAEVIWYAVENPADGSLGEPGMRTVYRRVLLVAPWVDLSSAPATTGDPLMDFKNFYDNFDISARIENGQFIPNTVEDLVKRENRFAHFGLPPNFGEFPWALDHRKVRLSFTGDHPFWPLEGERQGEDLILNDVLAFDIRVYDPGAPILDAAGSVVEPSEAGWNEPTPTVNLDPVGFGAYVDLYWDAIDTWSPGTSRAWTTNTNDPFPLFSGRPNPKSKLDFSLDPLASVSYDTWSFHYENDGIDQDPSNATMSNIVDQGTNGLDDDNTNGTDDVGERETAPPYDVPLRGIQVKLRIYERDTRQIREATVTRGFVP